MKKSLILFLSIILSASCAFADDNSNELLLKIKYHRSSIYDSLQLTQEQTQKINDLDSKLYSQIEPELKKITVFSKKLEDIANSGNCTKKAVNEVKRDFRAVQRDMNSIKDEYEKEFKTVLNKEQKSKYRKAKKQKRAELKKEMQREKAKFLFDKLKEKNE